MLTLDFGGFERFLTVVVINYNFKGKVMGRPYQAIEYSGSDVF